MGVIYEPSGRAREYSPLACNIYNGCEHRCSYCYVRTMPQGQSPTPKPRKDILRKVKRHCRKYEGDSRPVLLCFMCDPYPSEYMDMTAQVIEMMGKHDIAPNVLTKSGKAPEADLNVIAESGGYYGCSMSFTNDADRKKWEPGAAPIHKRIECLRAAANAGCATWVSIEPTIDTKQAFEVVEMVEDIVDVIAVGKWNHDKRADDIDWVEYTNKMHSLLLSSDVSFLIKHDLARDLEEGRQANMLNGHLETRRHHAERELQEALF